MRKKIVAANWKMNIPSLAESLRLTQVIMAKLPATPVQTILLPPFVCLPGIRNLIAASDQQIAFGAQNCHQEAKGAFTGETSASLLRSMGARYVLVGHSERRQYCNETPALLAQKVSTALEAGLIPLFCCGESKAIREADRQIEFVQQQLQESLFHLSTEAFSQLVIAYEPIWAIGSGKTPPPATVQAMHKALRNTISEQYGGAIAQNIPILYGGSCNEHNAASFFAGEDVDGGLIGSAALQPEAFVAIVKDLHHND